MTCGAATERPSQSRVVATEYDGWDSDGVRSRSDVTGEWATAGAGTAAVTLRAGRAGALC
jgi:hypothetical protein